ncbi:hypothetical protein L873DRAFT_1768251 [Choiromyces venosus 120613-1]|uniref:Uncharacterized protein n=1 Tax=Choiromyces venosus 120613-1 TaxID=1336337 RepID=A0A3N4JZF7_9PEZI|nr:hypothetical protein L873DRAFT_1768251 [Choiromyces venosus 120613-1]
MMECSTGLFVAAAAVLQSVFSAPVVEKMQAVDDGIILNYALTLGHLENTFYRQGSENFTQAEFLAAGFTPEFYANLKEIALGEATHVGFLEKGLAAGGAVPVKLCTYAFGATTVEQLSVGFWRVGVSAYLGCRSKYYGEAYLTAAGSVPTVEARHSMPPLTFNEVFSLAFHFITSCPSDSPPLPFKALPTLSAASEEAIKAGSMITFTTGPGAKTHHECIYAAVISVTGPIFVKAEVVQENSFVVLVPKGVNGRTNVVLTSNGRAVRDDTTIAGPPIIEITN